MTETENDILEALAISADLSSEFSSQPSHFAHYAFQHARAEDMVRKCEERVELLFYQLYGAYRDDNPGAKENDCKSFIRQSVKHKRATKALHEAKKTRDVIKAAVRAFEMRRDMLIQLGANARAEFEGTDLGMNKKVARATKVIRETTKKSSRRRRRES